MLLEELRSQVLESALRMVADGLSHGSAGNISALDRTSGLIAITPSAMEYTRMEPEDVVVVDRDGVLVEGRWKPTSEIDMHVIFYRQRPEVGAVVHTHAPYASVFAIVNQPIPMVFAETAPILGRPVSVAPYARIATQELAEVVLDAIGRDVAVLLANHGLLCVGPDLVAAYRTSLAAEISARYVYMARAMGAEAVELDPAEVAALRKLALGSYYPISASAKPEKAIESKTIASVEQTLQQLVDAVSAADHRLDQAGYHRARQLFSACQADPSILSYVQKLAPEFGQSEFLLCVDKEGQPVAVSLGIIVDIQGVATRYPDIEQWFRLARLPQDGQPTLLVARWLCHLAGLRHRTVELFVDHPTQEGYTLIQVRNVNKVDAPGCFDLPVAGHVVALASVEKALLQESQEELGLGRDALVDLAHIGSYDYQEMPERPGLVNVEYRSVYHCRLDVESWLALKAEKREVAAVASFSVTELKALIEHFPERVASGLGSSIQLYLKYRANKRRSAS